ncbi:MAG: YcaO-like family protein [Acidimicrobiales bacterium]
MSSISGRLVDGRTGLITAVRPDDPRHRYLRSHSAFTAHVADTSRFATWRADPCGHGSALDNPDAARAAAVGEALERYCGNIEPTSLTRASFRELRESGHNALDPAQAAPYSASQYETPGFPFAPITAESTIAWIPGRDLVADTQVLVPACLVLLNYLPPPGEPTVAQMYAGMAAGTRRGQAYVSALLELIERDAMTIWWMSGAPGTEIDVNSDGRLAAWATELDEQGTVCRLLWLRTTFGVPVVGAFLHDTRRGLIAWGAASRGEPVAAAAKALVEAIDGLLFGVELLDPDARLYTMDGSAAAYAHPYRPFRADRSYVRSFRDDLRDVSDLASHTQLYLDPEAQQRITHRFEKPVEIVSLADMPEIGPDVFLHCVTALEREGVRAIAVDSTSADVAAAGWHVTRVLAPGLVGYAPAALPLLGGRRLYEVPHLLGWASEPLTEADLVRDPLPYS